MVGESIRFAYLFYIDMFSFMAHYSAIKHTRGKKLNKHKIMAPVRFTDDQMKWIEEEAKRVGGSKAAVIRSLVQGKVEGKK